MVLSIVANIDGSITNDMYFPLRFVDLFVLDLRMSIVNHDLLVGVRLCMKFTMLRTYIFNLCRSPFRTH